MLNITSFIESIASATLVLFDNDVTAPSIFPEPCPLANIPSVGTPIEIALPINDALMLSTYALVAASVSADGAEPNVT